MIAVAPVTGGGTLVLVVGPSGAGKDTLLAYARAVLGNDLRFVFVRRVVTRDGNAELEDHASLSPDAFEAAAAAGDFALSWQAHGLCYGIPKSALDEVAGGRIAIVNASRGSIATARTLVRRLVVAHVTAAPEVLAQRLKERGREDPASVLARLRRDAGRVTASEAVDIVNESSIEAAGDSLVALLRSLVDQTPPGR